MNKQPFPSTRTTGEVVGSTLGFKGFWFEFFMKSILWLLSIGSLAVRMIVRRSQGKSIVMLSRLVVNILISYLILVLGDDEIKIEVIFYFMAIVLGVLFHLFVDDPNKAHLKARDPYYTGVGILAAYYKCGYSKELVFNLSDGVLIYLAGHFISSIIGNESVGIIIQFGGVCLFFETLFLLIEDRKIKEELQSGDATSSHYNMIESGGYGDSDERSWRNPKI